MDNDGILNDEDGEQFDRWQEESEQIQFLESSSKEADTSLQQEGELLHDMRNAKIDRSISGLCSEPCDMPI